MVSFFIIFSIIFGFLFSIISIPSVDAYSAHSYFATRDIEKTNSINRLEQKINSIQLDVADLKISTTRIETKQNFKPQ
jgi:hypothetical protein